MKILISNDDGIGANGIRALAEALSEKHDVYVVAPDRERSAAGHSLTLHTPLRVDKLDDKTFKAKGVWSTTGTPGDCIKIAVSEILTADEQPDLIISGINHGPNLGMDIIYSGTVSCAMEGAMLGFPSIAVSYAGMKWDYENFKFASKFIVNLLDKKLNVEDFPPRTILNINIPSVDEEDIAGIAITEMGGRVFTNDYEKRIDPRGKTYYWLAGELTTEPADANTDISAVRNNKISITPVTYDMTHFAMLDELEELLCLDGGCNWFQE